MDNFQHAGLSIDLPPAQAAAESRPLPKFNREASSHVKLDVETNPIKKAQQWMAMPDDDPQANIHTIDDDEPLQRQTKEAGTRPKQKQSIFDTLFAIPAPLKPIFDRVPLLTYPANDLPLRSPRKRGENVLHVFTTLEDAKIGRPSFNPACLKWQAYLKFTGIPFTTGPSTNHASPSGALPYLQPAVSTTEPTKQPIPSNKLKRWIAAQNPSSTPHKEPEDPRHEAYASLLDHRIRRAWLYQLYLHPPNAPLLHTLYIAPTSSNPLVQLATLHSLRHAAETELLKSNPASTPPNTILESEILADAEEAWEALSALLGEDEWFSGAERAGWFDAGVFGYSELLLGEGMGWGENGMGEVIRRHGNLVRHRERVGGMYF
ncbi:phosphatidylserine decarboxylase [Friedmanniomyces endolithicus]|uniref:Phosphatidylserine decarboxylase n=1 Tax=Rachicladosporium monterosium TaxID=1507873 RepID=A0ABR0L7F9_9PEZI|nr:phosphatidylserine decarboxylase [Friedmanniomyces endolithicus]KAK5144660.1 phosphatidylserine decarboxylase [Rachicladosporium monterosium]